MKLHLQIKPSSKINEISRDVAGNWKVKVQAPPVDGKANKYLIEYLSGVLQIPKSKIVLLKGETSSFKTLEIEMDEATVIKRLLAYC